MTPVARWPRQQTLIRQLRQVLRREFGCEDAWVVVSRGRYRLEVRVDGRQRTLLEDDPEAFWGRFYDPVERRRLHLGEQIVQTVPWRKRPADLARVLRPYWQRLTGG